MGCHSLAAGGAGARPGPVVAKSASCTATATGPAFGAYNTLDTLPTDTNGSATVNCTLTTLIEAVNFTVSFGAGFSGNPASRYMLSGANPLYYKSI